MFVSLALNRVNKMSAKKNPKHFIMIDKEI